MRKEEKEKKKNEHKKNQGKSDEMNTKQYTYIYTNTKLIQLFTGCERRQCKTDDIMHKDNEIAL